jgi:hydroxylamine reductase
LVQQGREVGIDARIEKYGKDVTGLQETIVYGLKGAGAYLHHAHLLGEDDEGVYGQFHEIVDFVAGEPTDADDLLGYALKTGELNLLAMELLDRANTGTYGDPEPTEVRVTPVKGKSIVVSGHDLKDLEELLKQTQGEGINVYTHGEMLPCNAYPQLKKYDHLVGNYGGAWQEQQKEFADFPGAILMTTNCLMEPKDSYRDRIFTCGPVGWPGVTHIDGHDFSPVIDAALSQPGFQEDAPEKTITIGFGHNAVMGVADKVIDAVKAGDIRHFFLIGGCDGARPGRNYYTKLAEQVPEDCVILTLACGKYRFNKLEFGDIGGIPRLLDVGQCNDAYSAVKIAQALADAFDTDVNGLPLSLVLSWYEQKAVAILLTLFYLGIRDMRLGPTLPAFIEPAVLDVLVDKFQISPISTPEEDLQAILG